MSAYLCSYRHVETEPCTNPARGRLIGTGGEVGPLACWPCAIKAIEYEDGGRGWLPLEQVTNTYAAYNKFSDFAPQPEEDTDEDRS